MGPRETSARQRRTRKAVVYQVCACWFIIYLQFMWENLTTQANECREKKMYKKQFLDM